MDLTVITPTLDRPRHLATVLAQFRDQHHRLRVEHLVVSDGPDPEARRLAGRAGARYLEAAPGGRWGAAAKDLGVREAYGDYLAFWDDDNLYRPEALAVLHAAAYGVEIGVCQAIHRSPLKEFRDARDVRLPPAWDGAFRYGEVDTMCFAVAAAAARDAPGWDDGGGRGTDFRWIERVREAGARVRFLPVVIGQKL